MCIVWPPIQNVLSAFSDFVLNGSPRVGVFLYGLIVKLLNPLGLHTAFYTPFQYQFGSYVTLAGETVMGDKAIFFAQLADSVPITGGVFQNAAYAMDMFACWGGAVAIYVTAKPDRKKYVMGIMLSACITSFLTGITEPWLFAFLFTAPLCFVAYALLNATAYVICYSLGIRLVSTFACGLIDFLLVGVLNNAPGWVLVIPVGLVYAVLEFVIFRFLIIKLNYKTPGREDAVLEDATDAPAFVFSGPKNSKEVQQAEGILAALGGKENIIEISSCATRLRVSVKDEFLVKKNEFMKYGAKGVSDRGKNLQIVMGLSVRQVLQAIENLMQ